MGTLGLVIGLVSLSTMGTRSVLPGIGESPTAAPTPTPSATSSSPFSKADAQIAQLVQAPVDWHAPDRLDVDKPADVGVSIGSTDELRQRIAEALPGTTTTPGGTVRVSPDATAVLIVDPQEAEVVPSGETNASTGSQIGLLWTWRIHPLKPTANLRLTARIEVLLPETKQPLVRYVSLNLPVDRTVSFTAKQVFTNWGTWASIVAVFSGWVTFLWRRRRKSSDPTDPTPDPTTGASPGRASNLDRARRHRSRKRSRRP